MQKNNRESNVKTQGLYDRIADVHHLTMKLNRYEKSVTQYLRSLDLSLNSNSLVLDAGSGTGIVTMAFQSAGFEYKQIISLDLSQKSLEVARDEIAKLKRSGKNSPVQGNVLAMPFADETFDLLLTCGVLEYTPLDDGLNEAARVLKRGARLVFIPVKPSIVGSMLELLYNFKIHPLEKVRNAASRRFNILGNHEFPAIDPISWSKTIFLLEKK
jgi:demethylmenaquinone methyltransferase/2-methoxy-6-polyprenyl-1,4-benzoquinol methylase